MLVGRDDAPGAVTDAVVAAFASPAWASVANPRAYLYRAVRLTRPRRTGAERRAAAREASCGVGGHPR
ncbi:MAG: hypothetical protein WKF58_06990 [Ilumatobacteraceae bacterium]